MVHWRLVNAAPYSMIGANHRERPTMRHVNLPADLWSADRQRQLMKTSLLILAVVAITTGVASAHVFGPSRPLPRIDTKAQPETEAQPEFRAQPAISPSPITISPGGRAAALETRRQPVPIHLATRRSTAPQSVYPDAALPKDTVLGKMTESAAKAAIEGDGYKGVRILQRAADGGWRARALRGTIEVSLSVDLRGSVSAD